MSCPPITDWNLDSHRQLQLPHPDHPEDGYTDMDLDLRTQRSLQPALVGHTGSVLAVQFDATDDNDVIITGATHGNVIIWRFSTGEAVKTITGAHHESVLCLNFDKRYLVTGGRDKKIKLWNRYPRDVDSTDVPNFAVRPAQHGVYQEYSLLATFDGHRAAVNTLNLRDDIVVTGSGDWTMCIWSLQTGERLHEVNIHQRGIACLQYNGRFIVSGSSDNTARIYDVNRQAEVACLTGHTNLIRSVQAVYDNREEVETIISGSYDGSIRFWKQVPGSGEWRTQHQVDCSSFRAPENEQPDDGADGPGNRIFSVALDANRFVCSGQRPVIRVWDLNSPSTNSV
ncbi:putative WD40/YVTN repeat-like-containing domain superfamily [Septoria linicola]|nr:putative WD40/YVTN repeat-like-containing domain superfamily [Septoria linicola]